MANGILFMERPLYVLKVRKRMCGTGLVAIFV